MSSASHNSRASLLAGLRTGGVRSASLNVPHTAAPGASFNIPRLSSQHHHPSVYSEEDDQLSELSSQSVYANHTIHNRAIPLTAAVDGSNNRFAQQQVQIGLNPNSVPFNPAPFNQTTMPPTQLQNQAFQMQLLQLEMMRIQTQAQQYQAEMIAQAQRQQAQAQAQALAQARERRISLHNVPATASPHITAYDLRSATLSAQLRRANQTEQLRAQLRLSPPIAEEQVPMTAALGGRFGSRTASANGTLPRFVTEESEEYIGHMPATPGSTTIISGGTSLGNSNSSTVNSTAFPSRSDSATSWRRGGNNNSVLSGNNRTVSSPAVKITPPPGEHFQSPPPGITVTSPAAKSRPQPLHIFPAASKPFATVAIDGSTDGADDDAEVTSSSGGSGSARSALSNVSSPTTPRSSASSTNSETQLSPREEATKKLYEGLGIGRPVPSISSAPESTQHHYAIQHYNQQYHVAAMASHRMVSQPTRQPRGPPSGADELGPKNFATRIRRQAIGGLGMLMGARERRESYVEVY